MWWFTIGKKVFYINSKLTVLRDKYFVFHYSIGIIRAGEFENMIIFV
jgi:hypothetical protein